MRTEGFPRTFGPYLLLSSLGRGGMGEVFLGKKHALGDVDRLCIVKTLRGDLAEHQEYVRRFLDEARVVVQLNHAHICQVHETLHVGTEHCLAMEYIAGVNLKDLAADLALQGRRLDPGVALYLVSCVLDALAFAHRFKSPVSGEHLRVIHRDVSPANVMVSFDGDVKLIDFGLAESALKTEQTETRLVMGKVAYMAPEQARGEDIDPSCDQFAAGVVLYELLSGDRYYGGMNTHQIWQIVGRGGHVPAQWLAVPEGLRDVVARALDANPKHRFPSCDAMRDVVDELRARLYPRANKGQLRELMTATYGDRAEAERDLIASFSDLRAPDGAAQRAPAPEHIASADSQGSSAPSAGTEPWRNSPGSSDLPAAAGVVGTAVSRGPTGEMSTTAPISRPVVKRPVEPSEAIAPPRNTAGTLALAGGAAIVVAVIAGVWVADAQSRPEDETPRVVIADAGAAVAPTRPVLVGIVDAGTEAEPAVTASASSAGGVADAGTATGAPPRPDPRRKPTQPKPVVSDVAPVPVTADPPAVPQVPEPAQPGSLPERTLAEDLAIVRACKRDGVAGVLKLVDQQGGNIEAKATLIRFWARKCLDAK